MDLLKRIEEFDIDGGPVVCGFADRLARENNWTPEYTVRVIREYKRFVYLAMVAGHPVTPSNQVDQAWHLHLLYTKSYWNRFIGEVLPKPLHHEPSTGSDEDKAKHRDWFLNTLASYLRIFGEEPPPDVWQKVSPKNSSTGPARGRARFAWRVLVAITATLTALACIGCIALPLAQLESLGGLFLVLAGVLLFVIILGAALTGSSKKRQNTNNCGTSCGGSGSSGSKANDGDGDNGGGDSGGDGGGCGGGCGGD